jgi:hypothetical protein
MNRKKTAGVIFALTLAIGGAFAGYLIGRSGRAKETTEPSAKQLWTCSMHPQVLQDKPGACPICGMQLTPVRKDPGASGAPSGERKIKYWWDPMLNPPYISDKPGKSPMGMDLVPVYEDEVRAGPTVTIDPVVTQNIGVRVASVEEGPLTLAIRTVAYLREAETHQHDITLKVDGWIERLHANTEGMFVKKGDPLFDLYSPDVLVAQEELLLAHRALARLPAGTDERLRMDASRLVEGARQKLSLWNVPSEAIDETLRAFPNPDLLLKPGQFATAEFTVEVSPRALMVPREAVIDTGVRQIALVALDGGHFEPRLVRMGLETGDGRAQILTGLAPGERVVTSGQFLLDSESRMREAIQKMTGENLQKPPAKAPAQEPPMPSGKAPQGVKSDSVVAPYLQMGSELAKDRPVSPAAVDALTEAAGQLAALAGEAKAAVEAIDRAVGPLRDKPIKEQRESFKKLSEAMIELTRSMAPSNALGAKLFVIHCPMAEARWIQKTDEVANPYFGSEMLECGEVTTTIETVRP